MVRINFLILGYRKITIPPERLSDFTSILLRAGIQSQISAKGEIIVREKDILEIKEIIQGRIEFSCSEPCGIYGRWLRLENKWVYAVATAVSLVMILFLSSLVWDIRVEGNESITDGEIIQALSDCGFSIGDIWQSIDRSEIESNFLRESKNISWININRRGVVAYVKVIEKDDAKISEKEKLCYSNIVASQDCIIEEITVTQGTAMVGPGDVVQKGDILIMGALPDEAGGLFCPADGTIIGRVNDSVSVYVDRKYEQKSNFRKKLYLIKINFFNFSINIFKLYGNLPIECDIIENEKTYSLFNRCKLPISLTRMFIPEYDTGSKEYSDDELVQIASDRLSCAMVSRLGSADLVRVKSYGEFTDNGYTAGAEYTFLADVGERLAFSIE